MHDRCIHSGPIFIGLFLDKHNIYWENNIFACAEECKFTKCSMAIKNAALTFFN